MPTRERPFRTRRITKTLVYLCVAAWITWVAISRWNGRPADPRGAELAGSWSASPIDPQKDRTEKLVAALAAIPPLPPLVLPKPPDGMTWDPSRTLSTLDAADVLMGNWSPQARPNMRGVVEYLQTPAVDKALKSLAAIEPGAVRGGSVNFSSFRQMAKLLCARARQRHAAQDDVDGALTDLATVLRLSSMLSQSKDSMSLLVALACRSLVFSELLQWSHERTLTVQQATQIASVIRQACPDQRGIWQCTISSYVDPMERLVDMVYTDDGHGDGWLVLSRIDQLAASPYSSAPYFSAEIRCGAWNILSPLFNDRRTVAAKLTRFRRACEPLGDLPYSQARLVEDIPQSDALCFSLLDGPLTQIGSWTYIGYLYEMTVRHVATQRACILAAALSAYRHDHGSYPSSLGVLTGDYLESLPNDPYSELPFRYKRDQNGRDYILYAVGPNQKDDGGKEIPRSPGAIAANQDGDIIFKHTRGEPFWEPKLVKAKP